MQHFISAVVFIEITTTKKEALFENDLIKACKGNSRKAQFKLYNKYCEGMYRVAMRFIKNPMEAEDAMQEAFINAFQKLDQYNGEVTFGAWLKRIVVNKCIDKLKSQKLELIALNEQVVQSVEEEENWEIENGIEVEVVKQCIENLKEKYRYPLMLFLMDGYDHTEISEILNITPVASRTLVYRGKKKIQEELKIRNHGTGY